MEPLDVAALPDGALVLVDTAPIVYVLEGHPQFAKRFAPLFARHAAGELRLAVTTTTLAEVLIGPLMQGEEALAKRLKLPDAVQVASALSIDAYALITHDRDFAVVRGLRIYG
jgi:predicted nucleic acid-binding protein